MQGGPGDIPFVGRGEVVAALGAAAEAAREGRGALALLTGDAGIGKTRVLGELCGSAARDGMRVLVGHCLEGGRAAPLWPWAQVLRAWSEDREALGLVEELGASLGVLAAAFPALADRFPNLPLAPPLDDRAARFRLLDAATAVLRRSARKVPLLVALEDLHWADEGSLRLLAFAARDLGDAPVLLVATLRDVEVDDEHPLAAGLADVARNATRYPLEGLAADEVASLWGAATGVPPSGPLAARVRERTGGNPLFVLETARSVSDPVSDGPEVEEVALPRGIRQALRPRVARRSPACRHVLETAAVIGEEFGLDLLARAVEAGPLAIDRESALAALAEAASAGLVARCAGTELRHRFAHALLRDLLYDDLGPAGQLDVHARIARALEQGPANEASHLAELAYHACRAAPGGGAEQAIEHARRAAEEALERFAPEDAVAIYERALDVLHWMPEPAPELHCDLLLELGVARVRCGRRGPAADCLTRAADLARRLGSPARLARIALAFPAAHTSTTMSASMGGERANALRSEALDALPPDERALRAKLLARLARGDAAGAERAAEAVAIARELGDPDLLAEALDAQHYVLWEPEHLHRRLAIALELDRLGRDSGSPFTCFRAGHAALGDELELGDRRALGLTLDRLDRLVDRLRQPALRLVPFHVRACEVFLDGDLAQYEDMIRQALATAQRAGGSDALGVYAGQLSMLRREQGRLDELLPGLQSLVARHPDVLAYRIHLGWIHAEAGRLEEAGEQLAWLAERGVGDALPRDGFLLLNLHFASETAVAVGDVNLAERLYERLLPFAGRVVVLGAVLCFGAVDRTLGRLAWRMGRDGDAAAHLARALEVDAGLEAAPCLAHSRLALAGFLASRGAPDDLLRARELLGEVVEASDRFGLVTAGRRARALLADLPGAPTPPPAGRDEPAESPSGHHDMRREGDTWLVRFEGHEVRVRHGKGLECLATLLAEPGREFTALELVGGPGARAGASEEDTLLDPQAIESYRAQARALREELAEAERFHDLGRGERLRAELEQLEAALSAGVGLGGRARRTSGAAERARKALYNRIRSAIGRIRPLHPELARHLEASVRTGRVCSYRPERETSWRIG